MCNRLVTMSNFWYILIIPLICDVCCYQIPTANPTTILDSIKNNMIIRHCKSAWTNEDSAPFLHKCNILTPDSNTMLSENSVGFLCIVYFDLTMRLCSEIKKNPKLESEMPQTKQNISEILHILDSPAIAKDYCNSSHKDILKISSNNSKTIKHVEVFVETMSTPLACELTCLEFNFTLNPLCKSIRWITQMLLSHKDMFESRDKLNEYVGIKNYPAVLPNQVNNSKNVIRQDAKMAVADQAKIGSSKPALVDVSSSIIANKIQSTLKDSNHSIVEQIQVGVGDKKTLTSFDEFKTKENLNSTLIDKAKQPVLQASVEKELQNKVSSNVISTNNEKPSVALEVKDDDNANIYNGEEVERPDVPGPADNEDVKQDTDQLDIDDDLPLMSEKQHIFETPKDKVKVESASGIAGGVAPVENINENEVFLTGKVVPAEDSHFFPYFLFLSGVLIFGYVVYHNKNKLLGLLLEGRKNYTRRRCPTGGPSYRKLDCTLEEAVNSAPPSHSPHVVY